MSLQTTDTLLMVRPARFGFNAETAANNAFQTNDQSRTPAEIQRDAVQEFDAFVATLREAGVRVIVAQDNEEPLKPDAVFPNNWVSFHHDGAVITYPMFSPLRRRERREEVVAQAIKDAGFDNSNRVHLEKYEAEDRYLEGTGSMILDHDYRIVYACISRRTDEALLAEFASVIGYEPVAFRSVDERGQDVYHTNVMMALGETFVVICLDSVPDEAERAMLTAKFAVTDKEIISISLAQMNAFAGNMLQVRNTTGDTFLVMSEQAYKSLTADQIARIGAHTRILHSPLYTIETYGGGSARCMLAEIFGRK